MLANIVGLSWPTDVEVLVKDHSIRSMPYEGIKKFF